CRDVRGELGAALPPQCTEHLCIEASRLAGAGLGLFAARELQADTLVAHYAGDLHNL
ncbi:frmA, partial [Symbiodinium natans]